MYQKSVKEEQRKYFSNVILKNVNNPRLLFQTIGSVLNPSKPTLLECCSEKCEQFLSYFIDKVALIRANLSLPTLIPTTDMMTGSAVFSKFEPVPLSSLSNMVNQLKVASSFIDPIPPRLRKCG